MDMTILKEKKMYLNFNVSSTNCLVLINKKYSKQ